MHLPDRVCVQAEQILADLRALKRPKSIRIVPILICYDRNALLRQVSFQIAILTSRKNYRFDFIRTHRALLAAPIRAEAPHILYPFVRTGLGEEAMIGVYAPGYAAELDDASTTWLINAADPQGVIVDTAEARRACIFDCMGQLLKEQELIPGLSRIQIPLGGYARLEK